MADVELKVVLCIAGVIGLHFYFRSLVKSVLKDNSYFAREILEEFERMQHQRAEWAESFQRVDPILRKESKQTSDKGTRERVIKVALRHQRNSFRLCQSRTRTIR